MGEVLTFLLGGLGETLASVRRVALATDGGAGPAVGGGGDVCSQGRQGTFPSVGERQGDFSALRVT